MLSNALSSILTKPQNLCLDFEETMCSMIVHIIACKKVSFATIGWNNRQQTTHHPIKLIGLLLGKAVNIKGINTMMIPFE
jgi:hypothetical protein